MKPIILCIALTFTLPHVQAPASDSEGGEKTAAMDDEFDIEKMFTIKQVRKGTHVEVKANKDGSSKGSFEVTLADYSSDEQKVKLEANTEQMIKCLLFTKNAGAQPRVKYGFKSKGQNMDDVQGQPVPLLMKVKVTAIRDDIDDDIMEIMSNQGGSRNGSGDESENAAAPPGTLNGEEDVTRRRAL